MITEQTEATGRGIVLFHHQWSAEAGRDQKRRPRETWPIDGGPDREAVLESVQKAAGYRNYEVIVVD